MSNTSLYFSIHYLFYLQPKWQHLALNTFSDLKTFTEHLPQFLTSVNAKNPTYYIQRLNSFCVDTYTKKLSSLGIHWIDVNHPDYPQSLLELVDPPLILYYQGELKFLKEPCLGVVGTRHPSTYGKECATFFTKKLSSYVNIVSGLAIGIDGIAHQVAVQEESPTIAVLPAGLDSIYPKRHFNLAQQIIKKGCLISEFPIGCHPEKFHFPQRNRIISGLSQAILVIEAKKRSGALITAHIAVEQNKDVFVIPGSIFSALSAGCHQLLQEGAILTTSFEDILNNLTDLQPIEAINESFQTISLTKSQKTILDLIDNENTTLDTIAEKSKLPFPQILQDLSHLELEGLIRQNHETIQKIL